MNLQKHTRIHIPEWLRAAEGESCTWPGCGRCDGTIVAAHSNMQVHGRGMHRRADDLFIAYLCSTCHYEYDYGKNLSRHEKEMRFMLAMSKTWGRIYEKGLICAA